MLCGHAVPVLAHVWTHGISASARLQTKQPATRGWDSDRAAAVTTVCDRQHARRHGSRSAAARATRCTRQIPRISTGSEQHGFRDRQNAKLGRVGLAEHQKACSSIAANQFGVVLRHVISIKAAAGTHWRAGYGREQILYQERHASKRRVGIERLLGALARGLEELDDDRVQLPVQSLDAGDGFVAELERRYFAASN